MMVDERLNWNSHIDYVSGRCRKQMNLPGRERLRSAATQNYDISRVKLKFGERAFAVAAPKAWNCLLDSLKQINDTVKFRKDLKTHLFNLAYNQLTFCVTFGLL